MYLHTHTYLLFSDPSQIVLLFLLFDNGCTMATLVMHTILLAPGTTKVCRLPMSLTPVGMVNSSTTMCACLSLPVANQILLSPMYSAQSIYTQNTRAKVHSYVAGEIIRQYFIFQDFLTDL